MKNKLATILGVTLALAFVGVALAADATPGTIDTDVFVMGLKDTGSSMVRADYIPAGGGTPDASRSISITGYGGYEFKVADSTLSDPWEGSMVVSADSEVAALAELMFTGGSASDAERVGYYNAFSEPAMTLFLPYAVWSRPSADTVQFSRFTIQNTGGTATNLDITYVDRDGTSYGPFTTSIPGYGTKTLDMTDSSDSAMPDWTTTDYWTTDPGNGNWTGGVIIEAETHPVAAALINVWPEYAASYSALTSGDDTVYLTNIERKLYDATDESHGSWEGLTSIIVQNFDLGSSVDITVTFVSKASGLTRSFNDTLVAGGAKGYNTRAGADTPGGRAYYEDLSYWDDTVIPGNDLLYDWTDGYTIWVGSAYIEGGPGAQIAAAVFNVKMRQATSAMYASVSDSDASQMLAIPTAWRRRSTASDRWSLLRIMNVGTAEATDVDFYFYNQNGTLAMSLLDQSAVQYQIVDGMNLRSAATFGALSDDWVGTIVITSDQPIVGTSDLLWSAAQYGAFNAYAMESPAP